MQLHLLSPDWRHHNFVSRYFWEEFALVVVIGKVDYNHIIAVNFHYTIKQHQLYRPQCDYQHNSNMSNKSHTIKVILQSYKAMLKTVQSNR